MLILSTVPSKAILSSFVFFIDVEVAICIVVVVITVVHVGPFVIDTIDPILVVFIRILPND